MQTMLGISTVHTRLSTLDRVNDGYAFKVKVGKKLSPPLHLVSVVETEDTDGVTSVNWQWWRPLAATFVTS